MSGENDHMTVKQAADFLDVDVEIIERFTSSNSTNIGSIIVSGERRFHIGDLLASREVDPTFGGIKSLTKQIRIASSASKVTAYDRRVILKAAAISALGSVALTTIVEGTIGNTLGNIFGSAHERGVLEAERVARDTATSQKLFASLFGQFGKDWSFHLGRIYADHGGYHRDHDAAFRSLIHGLPAHSPADALISFRDPVRTTVKGDMAVIGGPLSTPIVGLAWQYEAVGKSGFKRAKDLLLRLPYSFLVDETDPRMNTMRKFGWIMADGSLGKSMNRPVIDLDDSSKLYIPHSSTETIEVGGEHLSVPGQNDLIITRIPNFLSTQYNLDRGTNPATWGSLVVIQATNGIGTRAAGLLLTSAGKEALVSANQAVSGADAFQVHFRASNHIVSNGIHEFTEINYERSSVLDNKQLPIGNFKTLREIILNEYGTPT
jgi:hypothetical protein